jgi:Gelsolin repeat
LTYPFGINFCCEGDLKVREIHNFSQDDLMTEDIFILDCHIDVFVWIGQNVDAKLKSQAFTVGEVHVLLLIPYRCLFKLEVLSLKVKLQQSGFKFTLK